MSEQLSMFAPQIAPPPGMADAMLEAEWNEFWEAWPGRPNDPKKPARASYKRQRRLGATATEILNGLRAYQFSPDPTFRPMATTFLNQQRFRCAPVDLLADPYGLGEFLATLPREGLSPASYDRSVLEAIMSAAGWGPAWRGPLEALNAWCRDGYPPESICLTIAEAVGEQGGRTSLAAFDKLVRFRCRKVLP